MEPINVEGPSEEVGNVLEEGRHNLGSDIRRRILTNNTNNNNRSPT